MLIELSIVPRPLELVSMWVDVLNKLIDLGWFCSYWGLGNQMCFVYYDLVSLSIVHLKCFSPNIY